MPNKNSYLAVGITAQTRQSLHAAALGCHAVAAQHQCNFDTMSFDDLHITFFFMGEALRPLSSDQLGSFHQSVADAVLEADLPAQQLHFESLELFPPTKTNLIVAKFAVSAELRRLQMQVLELARMHGIGGSDSQRQQLYGDDSWTPHCTLGKLQAPSSSVARVGERVIKQLSIEMDGATGTGLVMCGAVPKQRWLDWDNSLLFSCHEAAEHSDAASAEDDAVECSVQGIKLGQLGKDPLFRICGFCDKAELARLRACRKKFQRIVDTYSESVPTAKD